MPSTLHYRTFTPKLRYSDQNPKNLQANEQALKPCVSIGSSQGPFFADSGSGVGDAALCRASVLEIEQLVGCATDLET